MNANGLYKTSDRSSRPCSELGVSRVVTNMMKGLLIEYGHVFWCGLILYADVDLKYGSCTCLHDILPK